MNKPSVQYVWASLVYSSLENAKHWVPKAEWDDIVCYVEKSTYNFAVDQWDYFVEENEKHRSKLRSAIEELKAAKEQMFRNAALFAYCADPNTTKEDSVLRLYEGYDISSRAIERIDKFLKEIE